MIDGIVHAADRTIARIDGLDGAMHGEALRIGSTIAVVVALEKDGAVAALLGEGAVERGDGAARTERMLEVPVGDALLGRVVDPLGRPIDGGAAFEGERRPIDRRVRTVRDRETIRYAILETGITWIDLIAPLNRGEHRLVVGEPRSGKTTLVTTAALAARSERPCVFVAIGWEQQEIARLRELCQRRGSWSATTIVAAPSSSPPAVRLLAPAAACTIAEHFAEDRDVLLIVDDASRHRAAASELANALHRPIDGTWSLTGRIGTRERGSLTLLTACEANPADATNAFYMDLLCASDGRLFLDRDRFTHGYRPALSPRGVTLSKLGPAALPRSMRRVAGSLRLDLAQHEEKKAFEALAKKELDVATKQMIARGDRLLAMLNQPPYATRTLAQSWALAIAVVRGHFDAVDPIDVEALIPKLLASLDDLGEPPKVDAPDLERTIGARIVLALESLSR